MLSCVAYGCNNRLGDFIGTMKVKFYRFPSQDEPVLRQAWINALKRKNWAPNKRSYLCSQHFTGNMMDFTHASGPWLKPGSIPSVFKAHPAQSKPERIVETPYMVLEHRIQNLNALVVLYNHTNEKMPNTSSRAIEAASAIIRIKNLQHQDLPQIGSFLEEVEDNALKSLKLLLLNVMIPKSKRTAEYVKRNVIAISHEVQIGDPRGFERNLEAEKVIQAIEDASGELMLIVKWKGTEETSLVPKDQALERIPDLIIQFYEERLTGNTLDLLDDDPEE